MARVSLTSPAGRPSLMLPSGRLITCPVGQTITVDVSEIELACLQANKWTVPSGSTLSPATVDASGLVYAGTGVAANSTVSVYVNGTLVGTATANAGGSWSYTFSSAPASNASITYAAVTAPAVVAPIVLNAISLSGASFTAGAAAGTVIGTIAGLTVGSSVAFTPNDGRVTTNAGGTALVVGLTASSAGTISGTLIETLGPVSRSTSVTITINAPAPVYRTDATNADASNILPSQGGSSWATTTRVPLWSMNPIPQGSLLRMAVPLWAFSPAGLIVEMDLPQSFDFACALEYPFTQATSGLAVTNRYQATIVGGAKADSVLSARLAA